MLMGTKIVLLCIVEERKTCRFGKKEGEYYSIYCRNTHSQHVARWLFMLHQIKWTLGSNLWALASPFPHRWWWCWGEDACNLGMDEGVCMSSCVWLDVCVAQGHRHTQQTDLDEVRAVSWLCAWPFPPMVPSLSTQMCGCCIHRIETDMDCG